MNDRENRIDKQAVTGNSVQGR